MQTRQHLTIRTPEGIVFPLELASPVLRFFALAIDQVCIYLLSGIVSAGASLVGIVNWDLAGALWMLSSFVVSMAYPMALEWAWRGQTVGKRLLRLQVMDERGLRLHFSQVVVRNLLRFVDAMPAFYLVGALSALCSRHGQRIGDLAANTIVVRHPPILEPDLDQVLPGKYNSFRAHPHLGARLRQRVSPGEAGIAFRAILRRDALDDAARLRLFGELRRHFDHLVRFPADVADGISDEQYVRNCVDLLFK